MHHSKKSASLSEALEGMGIVALPILKGAKAVDLDDNSILIVHAKSVFDVPKDQDESLINPHDMRKSGIMVNEACKRHGGSQNMIVEDVEVTLDFCDDKILHFKIRLLTDKELSEKCICWLVNDNSNVSRGLLRSTDNVSSKSDYSSVIYH